MNSEPNATVKKTREESLPSPCKKRRRSYKVSGSEDAPPTKRGRKPNRSRHNSDSDDTSEHSLPASTNLSTTTNDSRYSRSPRPRKYNFFFDFEGTGYDRTQRIAILTQKIQEIRKCYQEEKLALAAIEKRRKKIKRRQKESELILFLNEPESISSIFEYLFNVIFFRCEDGEAGVDVCLS